MWRGLGEAWTALSYLIGGIVVWGGVGLGIDTLLGTRPVFLLIGAVLGNFGGTYLLYIHMFPKDQNEESEQDHRDAA